MAGKFKLSTLMVGMMMLTFSLSIYAVPTALHHWDASNPLGTGVQPANGSNPAAWVDLVGGNNAPVSFGAPTYLTGDGSTIGGLPTFRFTTADGFASSLPITDQSVTVFTVSKLNGGANQRLITGVNPTNYLLGYWGGNEDRAFNGSFFGQASTATTDTHLYIHQAQNNGVDVLRDGDDVFSNSIGGGSGTAIGRLGFGGRNWAANEASNGDISEIIVYDSDLSAADFHAIGKQLAQKYGINAFTAEPGVSSAGQLTGGDSGEGGDFVGKFVYAINFTRNDDTLGPVQVGDSVFTKFSSTPGLTFNAPNEVPSPWVALELGGSSNDDALEAVASTIRWATPGQGGVQVDLDGLIAGKEYKLQMMFAEGCCDNREFDIYVDGFQAFDDFNIAAIAGGVGNTAAAALFTYEFMATDTMLNIELLGFNPGTDTNPTISALTLEIITPEPATATLGLIGIFGMVMRRRRTA